MTTIKQQIEADFKAAYIAKDMFKKNVLATIKAEVSRGEAGLREFNDSDMTKLLKKMIDGLKQIGGEDSEKEIEVLNSYLPTQMSQSLLTEKVKLIVSMVPEGEKNVGKITGSVIKELNVNYAGMYDTASVGPLVKQLLNL